VSECGALPLAPCAPDIEVDGEFVGPSYWRAHLHEVSFALREANGDTRRELENGAAHVAYTTDGSRPDCMRGMVYEWGTYVTLYNTSTVTAGVCAAGVFSEQVKRATLVVVTPHLHSHYPIFWLSRERHCARIDAPMAAFVRGPNKMMVTWADGQTKAVHPYQTIEHHAKDDVGPESVLACSDDPYPENALYGWAESNRGEDNGGAAAAKGGEGTVEVEEPDGKEVSVPKSSVEYSDRDGMARIKMPDGSYMQVPKYEVEEKRTAPFRPWSTWSAHPIPGVEVDRNWMEGLRPYHKGKDRHGRWKFGGGDYDRYNGEFHQWKVVYRSYDGSVIRVEAPPGTFKTQGVSEAGKASSSAMLAQTRGALDKVRVEWPNGKSHAYVYKTAEEVPADDNGPAGVNLISFKGEFPLEVVDGWAEQNVAPADAYPADRDDARHLEKAGVNVKAGFMTGESGDRRVAVDTPTQPSASWAKVPVETKAPAPSPAPAANKTAPAAKKAEHPTIDLIIEKAAQSALEANKDRKHAEAVAAELKTKVAELTKKLQAVEKVEKRNEDMIHKLPETDTERQESWFKRVAGGSQLQSTDAEGRKWAAIREEERLARAAQMKASEDRPRRIPIGANAPEPEGAYAVAVPAGQEAYSERHSAVKAVGTKFPVLSVSRDGTQIRIAAPNDGSFPVGPARLEVETADGGEGLFPYQAVSAVAEFAKDSPIVASGLLFTAPAGGQYPLNAAYVMAVADPAHFPIAWREADGSAIKVVAPNDGTFGPGPGAVLVKRVGGEEDVYAYQSLKSDPASPHTGPAGLLLTAANGTRFPRQGAFAGPGDATALHLKKHAFSVLWRSLDGSEIKVQAPNDGTFNLGPSRFFIRLSGGGMAQFPYDSVSLSPADDRGPAGLLFKAPPEEVYPEEARSVEPDGFPEPYPVFGRSSDGETIYVQAPNDGTFEPGPATLRLRLANAQVFTFPYSFIAWYPPKDGLPGGLAVTAPEGVHYPESVAYAGPIDGLKRHRPAHELPVHNEEWPQRRAPRHGDTQCVPVAAPVRIKVVEAMSAKPYETGVLCEGKTAYLDKTDIVFREIPDALKGQTFVRGADSDVTATGANFLVMQLAAPTDLFLLWDERGLPKMGGKLPAWVDSGFVDTGSVVWLSAGPMVVLRSKMPVSGPIYLGGTGAYPGKGAVNSYIAVVAGAGAISGTGERGGGSQEGGVETWVKKPQQSGALDLQVLLYKDNQHLVVRTSQNPFPKGRGYLRITAVDYAPGAGPEDQASVGQLVAYGEVADIEPGFVGYPGVTIAAMGPNQFPAGIRSVEPTTFRVLAVRAGGAQLEVDAPQDGWFPAGPATLSLVLSDGSRTSVVYESVGALAARGWGGLVFTALEGEAFPQAAVWATPGGPAAGPAAPGSPNPALSAFPRKDVEVKGMYKVAWLSPKRDELRVECPSDAFEPGPAKMVVRTTNTRGVLQAGVQVEYSSAAAVVADADAGAGMLFSASHLHLFPEDAAMASPVSFHVAAVRKDGTQIQALATLASFPPGPASLRLVRADGRASAFPYQTVVQLSANAGVLFTAPHGFLYPENADYVEKIATVKQDPLDGAEAVGDAEARGGSGGAHRGGGHATPWLDHHPTGALVVTEARATSGRKVAVSVAVPGASLYTDRVAALLHVPVEIYGKPLVILADGDRNSHAADLLRLRANVASYLYILRDPRGTRALGGSEPLWLSSSFEETGEKVQTSMGDMPSLAVYRSKKPMLGPIRLGGNAAFPSRGARHNYAVIFQARVLKHKKTKVNDKKKNLFLSRTLDYRSYNAPLSSRHTCPRIPKRQNKPCLLYTHIRVHTHTHTHTHKISSKKAKPLYRVDIEDISGTD